MIEAGVDLRQEYPDRVEYDPDRSKIRRRFWVEEHPNGLLPRL